MFPVLISSLVGSVQKGPVAKTKLSGRAGKLKKKKAKFVYPAGPRSLKEVKSW